MTDHGATEHGDPAAGAARDPAPVDVGAVAMTACAFHRGWWDELTRQLSRRAGGTVPGS